MTFEEVWNELKSEDTTGVFAKAEELSLVSVEAIEYAFNSGYAEAKAKFERPKGEWIIDGYHIRCNKCNEYICTQDREGAVIPNNFCPNCGADMRGKKNDNRNA